MKTLQDIDLNENDRQAISAAAVRLRQEFPVERVILFGSKARGEASRESDIDLLVLTRRMLTPKERDQVIDSLFDLELERNVVLSLLIASVEQRETGAYRVLPIRDEIERDGIAA